MSRKARKIIYEIIMLPFESEAEREKVRDQISEIIAEYVVEKIERQVITKE